LSNFRLENNKTHPGTMASGHGDSDDETSAGSSYKPPQKVDFNTIVAHDEEDESLARYKKMLLGDAANAKETGVACIDANDPRIVLPIRITLMFDNHKPDIVFDLSGSSGHLREKYSKQTVTIKEGETYRSQLEFYVQRDIVTGLYLVNKVLKAKTITVDKSKYMIGSRAPSKDPQVYLTETEHAPSGILSRGSFLVKSKLTDDDKNVFAEWEWTLVIAKDWH